jgi:CrcB protein
MMSFLIVFIGAGIGGSIRHGVNLLAARLVGVSFPYGTISINIVGSLLMGLCAAYFAFRGEGASQPWRLFLTTGILGGFTTFSTFSLDVAVLWERGDVIGALLYVLGSVILSILALFLALWLARSVLA